MPEDTNSKHGIGRADRQLVPVTDNLPSTELREADYGYPIIEGRRKVILWSKMPWTNVDSLGHVEI